MAEVIGYRARKCRTSATCLESDRCSVGADRAHLGPADVPSSAAPFVPARLEAQSGALVSRLNWASVQWKATSTV